MTARVDVGLRGREYPILIGAELLRDASVLSGAVDARDVLIVTSETVGPLYLERVRTCLSGKRVQALALPDGEASQDARYRGPHLRRHGRGALQPRRVHRRARRGRGRRHGRVRRRLLPARCRFRPAADHAARAGRRLDRRQNGREPSRREEPDRRLSPAGRGDRRHLDAGDAAAPRVSLRPRRSRQARAGCRCGVSRLARGSSR